MSVAARRGVLLAALPSTRGRKGRFAGASDAASNSSADPDLFLPIDKLQWMQDRLVPVGVLAQPLRSRHHDRYRTPGKGARMDRPMKCNLRRR